MSTCCANFDISREHVLLIGVDDWKIGRTMSQFRKTWAQRSKTWGTFNIFLARSCFEGNALDEDIPSALFNQHFWYVFAVRISWRTWSQLPRVYKFSSSALCTTELSATWSCSRKSCVFKFRDRNFVGFRPVWRTLTTHVRRTGQARRWCPPDGYKT